MSDEVRDSARERIFLVFNQAIDEERQAQGGGTKNAEGDSLARSAR